MLKLVKIIVDKKSLGEKISQVQDGDLIELAFVAAQDDRGNHAPAFLHLAAIHSNGIYEDLESIDESTAGMCTEEIA